MSTGQPTHCHAIHVEIGVTYTKQGSPCRKHFYLNGFETREIAQLYADWLDKLLHEFITDTRLNISAHDIWIVCPMTITTTQASLKQTSGVYLNLYPYTQFICIINAIMSAFEIQLDATYTMPEPLSNSTFNSTKNQSHNNTSTNACE